MVSVALIVLAVMVAGGLLQQRHTWPRRWQVWGWPAVGALLALAAVLSPGSYELRKFAGLCLMPAGLVWLALLGFARALAWRGSRRPARFALALWFLYTLAGNAWLGSALTGWLQRDYVAIDPFEQGSFDAVLVLGGGVEIGEDGAPVLTAVGDRVVLAVRLYRAGKADLLVTSGPYVHVHAGRLASSAAATATLWRQLGVPGNDILPLEGPRTTTDEVRTLKRVATEHGWRRVGLLTSAWHLRRATALCRRYGVRATPLPADVITMPPAQLRWLVPQADGFWPVQIACWEFLGSLVGR
jgi:uncharacterized SAM-binding protein YcdF (DUF218 family)